MVILILILVLPCLAAFATFLVTFIAKIKSKKHYAFIAFLFVLNLELLYFKVEDSLNEKYNIYDDGWEVVTLETQYGSSLSAYDHEYEIQRGNCCAYNVLEVAENENLVVGLYRKSDGKREYFLIDSKQDSTMYVTAFDDLNQNVFTHNDLKSAKTYLEQQREKIEGENNFKLKLFWGTLLISLLVTSLEYGIVYLFRKYLRDWR
ncbi:MAG: hypothetical protein MJZ23_05765 [Paludibacteraceae bacterium]|nr:hypothetical protein [Paludibacteraceae bacterium]